MTLCRRLASCVIAALCTGIASAQVAYVYIPNGTSTYGYSVSSTGKLKAIEGSPFPTAGDLVGSNGSYFITVDSQFVYSYPIASNGAIGEQASDVNTLDYAGSACGSPSGGGRANPTAGLDQTGQDVYVPLYEANSATCDAIQTFTISKTGTFTFDGATIYAEGTNIAGHESVPTLTGNNKFAYNYLSVLGNCEGSGVRAFSRETFGALNNINFTATGPEPGPGYTAYLLTSGMAADTTDHLAIVVEPTNGCGTGNG